MTIQGDQTGLTGLEAPGRATNLSEVPFLARVPKKVPSGGLSLVTGPKHGGGGLQAARS